MRNLGIILLLVSTFSEARLLGQGSIAAGFSQDDNTSNVGFDGDYQLNHSSKFSDSILMGAVQSGSNEGRAALSGLGHDYLYDSSYVRTSLSSTLNTTLNWFQLSGFVSRDISFENDEETGEVDYGNRTENQSYKLSSGFKWEGASGFEFSLNFDYGEQEFSSVKSDNRYGVAKVTRRMWPTTTVWTGLDKFCQKFQIENTEDSCKQSQFIGFQYTKRTAVFRVQAGESEKDQEKDTEYETVFEYQFNTKSAFNISAFKTVSSFQEEFEEELIPEQQLSVSRQGESLGYQYAWGRISVNAKARNYKWKSATESESGKDRVVYFDYKLGSTMCRQCTLGLNYQYQVTENINKRESTSFDLTKRHGPRFSSNLSYRETKDSSLGRLWSVSLLLSFKSQVRTVQAS